MKLFLVWAGLVAVFTVIGIIGGIAADNDFGREVILGSVIFGVVFATITFVCLIITVKTDKEVWNNGVCPTCGQAWEFKCATQGSGNNHTYYYECGNCHSVIEQHILR